MSFDNFFFFKSFIANTHVHADHISGTGKIKEFIPDCRSVISRASKAEADKYVDPKEVLWIGNIQLEVKATPGHTDGDFFFFFCIIFALK